MYENILDGRLHEVVGMDKMQYRFMPGRGTVVVFVLKSLTENFKAKNKLFLIFVDLEKVRVPKENIRFALRRKGVQNIW